MTSDKTGLGPSEAALLRYQAVSLVLTYELSGLGKQAAVELVAGMEHRDPQGGLQRVSQRTLYRWLKAFNTQGMVGLESAERQRVAGSRVLPAELFHFIAQQKRADPQASVPELIRRAQMSGVIEPNKHVDRTTVYRACKRLGLEVARRKTVAERDTRRFAYPHRLDMVLCDGKHFRAGASRARRVALFFLDDCSRYGLHVVVGTSENSCLFLRGLYELVRRYGLMTIVYLDHGSGFTADDTKAVIAALGALLILGEVAYPQGHGKVEVFNRGAKAGVLRGLDRRPDVDADCGALELRLQHYLHEVYNHQPHEALGGRSPAERFWADDKPLRLPESDAALRRRFNVQLKRRVSSDHVVSIDSEFYEVPRGHAGAQVAIERNVLDGRLRFCHRGQMIELAPLDPAKNARAQRARRRRRPDDETLHPLPHSAADMVYDREMSPVVDPDGGLTRAPRTDEED